MPGADSIRSEIQRMIHTSPFRKFVLSLDNGERALIEHPENIAFDPELEGSEDFYVISGKLRLLSTLSAVAGIYPPWPQRNLPVTHAHGQFTPCR